MKILDYGGIITSILVPDKDGKIGDITLGFDNMQDYQTKSPFFGALVGRVANRLAGSQFTLDGETHKLCANNGLNSLHGGKEGFDKKIWSAAVKNNQLVLSLVSPDGEENYPGTLTTTVTYSLDDEDRLTLDYRATTDKATLVNLTNHAYFNLAGHDCTQLNDHVVSIPAKSYLPTDESNIPTGKIVPVSGTEFDLSTPVKLGERMQAVREGRGFDNNFCLGDAGTMKLAARVDHPLSGRYMECRTTEPGIQLYTCHNLTTREGKGGATYRQYGAFCLEAQQYPDAIHNLDFPSTVLRPGEIYSQTTVYKFGLL